MALQPYMFVMLKLLLPILGIVGLVVWWKIRARASGSALRQSSKVLQNDQLEALFRRLADAAEIDELEVRLLPDRNVNGLATDTGEIYITQGLFDTYRSGEVSGAEIASVAAHEMGHLALGHMRRRMFEVGGRQAAQLILGSVLGRIIPVLGWHISSWILNLVTASLSRRDEFEADAYATALMIRSGIGSENQTSMLEKLPKLVPGAAAPNSWLASHPPIAERVEAINNNSERWKNNVPAIEG